MKKVDKSNSYRRPTLRIILPDFVEELSSSGQYSFREVFLVWLRSLGSEDKEKYATWAERKAKSVIRDNGAYVCPDCGSDARGERMGSLWCPKCKKPVIYKFSDFNVE